MYGEIKQRDGENKWLPCILLGCNPDLKIQFWISADLFYPSWLEGGSG